MEEEIGRETQAERWSRAAIFLHWSVALLLLLAAPLGWVANEVDRSPLSKTLFDVHFLLGLAIFVLVVARLARRALGPKHALSSDLRPVLRRISVAVHWLLYLCLLLMAVSGYLNQSQAQDALNLGFTEWPNLVARREDESLRALAWYVHTYTFWALLALTALHIGAALWHHLIRRDDTLNRMLPLPIRRR